MTGSKTILEAAMEIALPKETLDRIAQKFGPDKARSCAMSTSVGGIGPLLRERIFEQAEQGIDVIGVTLLYESVWVQAWHEWEQVNLQKIKVAEEIRKECTPSNLDFELDLFDGKKISVKVWELAYGKAKVYFLDAPEVTDMVYPGPKDAPAMVQNPYAWSHNHRLKQSWLVGRGALALSKKLNRKPDIAILSETPTLFVHHRLVQDTFQKDAFFKDVKYIFNDHTPLEYAHPIWDPYTLELVKVDTDLYTNTPAWNSHKMALDVTSLLTGYCDGVYGVAKKHGDVMQAMPSLHMYADRIKYITNGVRVEDWQAPEFNQSEKLSDKELLAVKEKKKADLISWAWRRFRLWPTWALEAKTKKIVLWTRRITPYKRLDLLPKILRQPDLRARFLNCDIILFVGGRIHQQDNHAQDIVYDLLDLLAHDNELSQRVIFIDNFNVWEAPILFQGADGALMLADDTREASATGFMKAQMNGAAILATADGAIPEFVNFFPDGKQPLPTTPSSPDAGYNGFNIPYIKGEPTVMGLLEAFEAMNRTFKNPANVVSTMRAALAATEKVSVARTVREMIILYEHVSPTIAPPPSPAQSVSH